MRRIGRKAIRVDLSFYDLLEAQRHKAQSEIGRPITITQITELLGNHRAFKFPEVGKEVASLVYKKKGRRF